MRYAILVLLGSCASQQHGTASNLTTSAESLELCEHRVPGETCTRCHPELADRFKRASDWCGEHGVPESQCLICHPDLSFDPLPELPESADMVKISSEGEDVPKLDAHLAAGKVTIFDFYADWCAPCRKVDHHVFTKLQTRGDLALRKLNVVSWDTPLAKRYLSNIPRLPYLIVYDRDGKRVREVVGFDLPALDAAIEEASRP
jgi:thiol-disulfide isomerase/thioredoxin